MEDITRKMTMAAKDGFRDAKSWGFGGQILWGSVTRVENPHGLTMLVLTLGLFGYSISLQFGHQDYRGG